jgi:hypothetical protein
MDIMKLRCLTCEREGGGEERERVHACAVWLEEGWLV